MVRETARSRIDNNKKSAQRDDLRIDVQSCDTGADSLCESYVPMGGPWHARSVTCALQLRASLAVERDLPFDPGHIYLQLIDTAPCIGIKQRGILTGAYFDGDSSLLHKILAPQGPFQ